MKRQYREMYPFLNTYRTFPDHHKKPMYVCTETNCKREVKGSRSTSAASIPRVSHSTLQNSWGQGELSHILMMVEKVL